MPIDLELARGAALPSRDLQWTPADVLLYHLSLGASDLPYVYERDLQVLPTFAMVTSTLGETEPPVLKMPGIDVDLVRTLHGRQELVMHKPMPTSAQVTAESRIVDVYDKGEGSAAIIVTETTTEYFTSRISMFVRGAGGFGGERGPSTSVAPPQRDPDAIILTPTFPNQALLYRLNGDLNPLHVDPEFAAMAGFSQPILHGLCTYGVVCMAIVDNMLGGDVSRVAGYSTRFAGVVYPGETLRTRVWAEGSQLILTTTVVERDDAPALSDAVIEVAQ